MRSAFDKSAKRCGTCRWLDAPDHVRKKDGSVLKRLDFRMYQCKVPFTVADYPKFPASVRVEIIDNPQFRGMCPSYGTNCAFHEKRAAA